MSWWSDVAEVVFDLSLEHVGWVSLWSVVGIGVCLAVLYAMFRWVIRLPRGRPCPELRGTLFGHRGARLPHLPENSIPSLIHAIQQGCDGVEIDTWLSKDRVPMVHHDWFLKRMCGREERVGDLTAEELERTPYLISSKEILGHYPNVVRDMESPYDHFCIPTLEQVVRLVEAKKKKLYIEVKELYRTEEMAEEIVDLYRRFPYLYEHGYVISFIPMALYYIRKRDPNICTVQLVAPNWLQEQFKQSADAFPWWLKILPLRFYDFFVHMCMITWFPTLSGSSALGYYNPLVSKSSVRRDRERGLETSVWVVNTEDRKKELLSFGCSVTTDTEFALKSPVQDSQTCTA